MNQIARLSLVDRADVGLSGCSLSGGQRGAGCHNIEQDGY
jgi:hypothetical protein